MRRANASPPGLRNSPLTLTLRLVTFCVLLRPKLIAALVVTCGHAAASPLFSLEKIFPTSLVSAPRIWNGLCRNRSPPRAIASSSVRVQMIKRGGTLQSNASDGQGEEGGVSLSDRRKKARKLALMVASVAFIAWKRVVIQEALGSLRGSNLKAWLIEKLDAVNDLGTPGLVMYSLLFALWEILVGVTTPVETAAGMAFGVRRGIIASAIGKIGGAIVAYFIGHLLLQDYVRKKLEGNEMMDLVEDSIRENPIGVAMIWRFSFLPEFVKNFGLSILPIKPIHFMTAVFLHGFPFTCLWTFLGAETGALARGIVTEPSRTLKTLISGVYVFGFFVSPTMVGLWVKSLRDKKKRKT